MLVECSLAIVLFLGTLGLVFFMSFRIQTLQPGTALMLFMVYAGLLGLMLSSVFLAYTGASLLAGMIGVLSGMNEHGLSLANMEVTRSMRLPGASDLYQPAPVFWP